MLKVTCQIENGANSINSLQEGLKLSFEGDIEKHSQNLGRDAVWEKKSTINRLVSLNLFFISSDFFIALINNLAAIFVRELRKILLEASL